MKYSLSSASKIFGISFAINLKIIGNKDFDVQKYKKCEKTLVCSFGINLISLILSFNQTKIFQESETISSLYLMIGTSV